jgi:methyltransferase
VTGAAAGMPPALGVFVAVLVAQRSGELWLSARNSRRLRALGGHPAGTGRFAPIVALHVAFPLALVAEVALLGARPTPWWPAWLAACVAAQGLRAASMRALGPRWHVRVWVVPGMAPVREGVYRFLRHPNYAAVVIELFAAPMMFGAWRTALVVSAVDALLLRSRIRDEEAALAGADAPGAAAHRPRAPQ